MDGQWLRIHARIRISNYFLIENNCKMDCQVTENLASARITLEFIIEINCKIKNKIFVLSVA